MRALTLDYATRQLVGRMSAAVARMAERYGADNEHCVRLRTKRDAIASGAAYTLHDAAPDVIRETAEGIGRLTRNTGLRRGASGS